MDWKMILSGIVGSVLTATIIGFGGFFGNWASSGGLLHVLGGLKPEDIKLEVIVGGSSGAFVDKDGNLVAIASQNLCPEGSTLISGYCSFLENGTAHIQDVGLGQEGFFCVWSGFNLANIANRPENPKAHAEAVCLRVAKK
jgi:hypothetical protein